MSETLTVSQRTIERGKLNLNFYMIMNVKNFASKKV